MTRQVDVAILGAGSAGLYALGQVRKATDSWVLIDGGELGTTCARVGCMPSKVAIQVGEDMHRRNIFDREGIEGGEQLILNQEDAMEHVQDLRDVFVDKVLSTSTDEMSEEEFIEGNARFVEPGVLEVNGERIEAKKVVIATGSTPLVPSAWESFRDRILTTDEFFEQEALPESVAVIGLGVIGLELGQALHRFGVDVTGIDMAGTIGGLEDPVARDVAIEIIGREFPLWLGEKAEVSEAGEGKLKVTAGDNEVEVDRLLVSMGRVPNVRELGLDALGVELNDNGVPVFDPHTMQVGDLPVFIAGDVTGDRPILHEAGDEGRIAGFNAVQETPVAFARKTPLSITFCDPNIVTVGQGWSELDEAAIAVGEVKMGLLGRAIIMGRNRGVLRVYADKRDGRILGATFVAALAEHLGHLLSWAIAQELTVFDLLKLPFYHPTMEEGLQAALYDLKGRFDVEFDHPVELRPLK
ncbi:dihydrolipoyl dehydrogenase [Thiohalobacter thiocyanaticus]|uniref:Dihydrolipoyl dehydrogenase n=1 Tax=Thiohalobacter thiocyanaticus TaxID=585455 RepID=A0A426QK89_9GAMM|nr:dihydrolipoyl dehydrogenase [Thiohalobacter thiocyanaticus]RRQ22160.1 dihydrolipoyl dehydrogenase [Thiohalobacter thiocyanaticus]